MTYEIEGRKVRIEGVNVIPALKNFSGNRFGSAGNQHFFITIDDPELLTALMNLGYNITEYTKTDDEGNEEVLYELKIRLRFDKFPPEVWTLSGDFSGAATKLDGDTIASLDSQKFLNCDISFTPYNWSNNGKTGTTAYLRKMIVVVPKEDFADKYPNLM